MSPGWIRLISANLATIFFAIGCSVAGVNVPPGVLPLGFLFSWVFLELTSGD